MCGISTGVDGRPGAMGSCLGKEPLFAEGFTCREEFPFKFSKEFTREGTVVGVARYKGTPLDRVALPQSSPERIKWRCSSCGLQCEAVNEAEVCPLLELEAEFLSADWFMISGTNSI